MSPVDTSSYGVAPIGNPVDAFTRAFSVAQSARAQQENAAALKEQRDALAAERQQRADALAQQAKDRELADQAITEGGGVRGATLAWATQHAPHSVPTLTEFFDKSDESAGRIKKLNTELATAQADHLGHLADGVLTHGATPDALKTALSLYAEQFPDEAPKVQQLGQQLAQMAPPQVAAYLEQVRNASPFWQAQEQKKADRGPLKVSPGETVLGPDGKPTFTAPAAPSPALREYQDAKAQGYTGTFEEYQTADANRRRSIVNVNGAGGTGDVKEAIAGMKDGTIPPQLPGRASKEYTAMMAEAHRQGYDLAGAAQDWVATQKHFATLNGAQQTRIRQAVDTASHSLDVIDQLADKWKGGRFPLLNKVTLAAAKGGIYGKDAQSIANQLDAQIGDVTSELANVYMGGNSPTDHALSLAAKNLSADWSQDVLRDMTKMARTNLQIRSNAIKNTDAVTPSSVKADAAASTEKPADLVWDPKTKTFKKAGG